MKLYVGNLSYGTTDTDLEKLFEPHGAVKSAQVIMDRDTGRSKGFGFVELDNGAEAAIAALNGQQIDGRSLTVNEARPREERGGSGGGSRGGFSGGRSGGFAGGRDRAGSSSRRY
jgi:RNA recognition motif-containing protein